MIFKYVYKVSGQHVHVNAFAGNRPGALAKAGVLCYNVREWDIFVIHHKDDPMFDFEEQVASGIPARTQIQPARG